MLQTQPENLTARASMKSPDLVLRQVAQDLSAVLESATNSKKKLRSISTRTGIHGRTLSRLLKAENKPTHLTVFKLYRYLTGCQTQEQVLNSSPEVIKNYLRQARAYRLEKNLNLETQTVEEISTNVVFAEIYVLCGAGPIKESEIQKKFGEYGLKVLQEMTAKNYIQLTQKGIYSLGANPIYLSPACVKSLGLLVTKNYGKPENGEERNKHFMGFVIESLTETAYREWLDADIKAYKTKLEIAKNPTNLGSKKVFAFQIVDTLETEESE